MLDTKFWQNQSLAQKTIKEKKFQEDLINSYKFSYDELTDLCELNELATEENNKSIVLRV